MHTAIVFCSACTMLYRKFTFAISSPDEFLFVSDCCDFYTNGNITLQLGYLEWLKYKSAKPLQYTVYRTRNRNEYSSSTYT